MKIQIGITTYNRFNITRLMAASLSHVRCIDECDIRIYDDCSTEYNIELLQELFPFRAKIIRRERNLRSDMNIFLMYKDFIESDNDVLLNADSDLIFSPTCIEIIKTLFNLTDGVMSLYNSNLHENLESMRYSEHHLNVKRDLGSAGCVFSKEIVRKIIDGVNAPDKALDWQWSSLLRGQGIRLLATNVSYIQHIGLIGQNCSRNLIDFGINFECGNSVNEGILLNCLQEHLLGHNEFMSSVFQRYRAKFNKRLIWVLFALTALNVGLLFAMSYSCGTIFN